MAIRTGELSAADIAHNFADIAPAMSKQEAFAESGRCLFCYDAPCMTACPTHIDVPAFIKKIHNDNIRGAARVILDANPMGHSCARACPVENLCEGACVLNAGEHRPIQIGRLQRHATDAALSFTTPLFVPGPPTGKHVAVVGAGPAGLSCAQKLRQLGHDVTVFERREQPGGLNTYGIAQYKLLPETALAEAKMIAELGVRFEYGVVVGQTMTFADLEQRFDAVFVGAGLGQTQQLGIPGEDLPGVVDALTFIEHLKHKPYGSFRVPDRVLVVGAGNTAVDAATQAKRLGARSVAFVYRRTEDEAPAYPYEIELAKKDGCTFHWLTAPVRIEGNDKGITGLVCQRMALADVVAGAPKGRRGVVPVANSEHTLACDLVIKAVGQQKHSFLSAIPGVTCDEAGRVITSAVMQTTNPKFFAGGDCKNGGKEIVNAAADGVNAARGIDAYLRR